MLYVCRIMAKVYSMKDVESMLDKIKGKLVVSCQALPEEPLHSSFIMGRMPWRLNKGAQQPLGLRVEKI